MSAIIYLLAWCPSFWHWWWHRQPDIGTSLVKLWVRRVLILTILNIFCLTTILIFRRAGKLTRLHCKGCDVKIRNIFIFLKCVWLTLMRKREEKISRQVGSSNAAEVNIYTEKVGVCVCHLFKTRLSRWVVEQKWGVKCSGRWKANANEA